MHMQNFRNRKCVKLSAVVLAQIAHGVVVVVLIRVYIKIELDGCTSKMQIHDSCIVSLIDYDYTCYICIKMQFNVLSPAAYECLPVYQQLKNSRYIMEVQMWKRVVLSTCVFLHVFELLNSFQVLLCMTLQLLFVDLDISNRFF